MILVDSRKLRFLRAGRTIRITAPRAYRKGRDYAAGVRHRHAILRVIVLSCTPDHGAYLLELRQHADIGERYLARNPGAQRKDYVLRPHEGLRGEGAVIDAQTLARYAREAYRRDDALRRVRAAQRQNTRRGRYAP